MVLQNIDLDTLRTLVVANDLGGYRQAAERLGRTPSAISLQMKRLQEDVGAKLFRKNGRNVVLSEAGEIVLRYGRRMLALNDELLDTVRGAALAGEMKIGFSQDFAGAILPQALLRFRKLYPLVQIEVRIDGNAVLAEAVENRQLDMALAIGHAQRRSARVLRELQLVWIAGREFSYRNDEVLPLVALGPQCVFRLQMQKALDQAGIGWRIAAVSPSLTGMWAAAIAGLGVTVRSGAGLPAGLKAEARMFDLPGLETVPITLHQAETDKPGAVERLSEIVSELVTQTFPGETRKSKAAPLRSMKRYA
jgi:DNA-binding transcriptional LysR family regulator